MESTTTMSHANRTASSDLRRQTREFEVPCNRRASWQLLNSVAPFVALWTLMYFGLSVSWWLVSLFAILAGVFLIRIFIIFHDCGHGVFFSSMRANQFVVFFVVCLCLRHIDNGIAITLIIMPRLVILMGVDREMCGR